MQHHVPIRRDYESLAALCVPHVGRDTQTCAKSLGFLVGAKGHHPGRPLYGPPLDTDRTQIGTGCPPRGKAHPGFRTSNSHGGAPRK